MADQVNPTGTLMPGLPSTPKATAAPKTAARSQQVQESRQPASPAETLPLGMDGKRMGATSQALDAAAQEVQNYLKNLPTELQFQVDKATGVFYFKVIDPATHEVIRQIPSEEVLGMARKLRELANPKGASGVLMDKEG
jgi:flagellar protein FlaG